jgi:DNA-binding MarR family transcriptional regulator
MQAKKLAAARAELVRALNHASREASGLGVIFAKAVADAMGVNQTDFECIDIIQLRGRMTAGELAAASGLTTGAVTGVIDRLEEAGFARRERDGTDRRKVYVSILPRTLAVGDAFYGSFEKAVEALIGRYGDAEIALLIDYFTRSRDLILAELARLKAKDEAPPPRALRRATAAERQRSRPPPRR